MLIRGEDPVAVDPAEVSRVHWALVMQLGQAGALVFQVADVENLQY